VRYTSAHEHPLQPREKYRAAAFVTLEVWLLRAGVPKVPTSNIGARSDLRLRSAPAHHIFALGDGRVNPAKT